MQKSNPKSTAKSAARSTGTEPPSQQQQFEKAMEAFHLRDFAQAKSLFEAVQAGPVKELVYAARQHLLMCEKRLAKANIKLESAEDFYNYGISQMNQRDLDGAQTSFEKALAREDADHVHYALALVFGLKQNISGAVQHLRRAIEISPRNRIAAHNDPDFAELAQHPEIRELLSGAQ
jgi:Tfp pilus assembly protein PilF